MNKNRKTGDEGEEIACSLLLEKQYELLERNWRNSHHEIDIIAKDKETTVFVEVKMRTSTEFGYPETAISNQKIRSVMDAAAIYLQGNPSKDIRFDVVSILKKTDAPIDILHIRDAFY